MATGEKHYKSRKALEGNYHPESAAYMEETHGFPLPREEAERLDQEWASNKLSSTKPNFSQDSMKALMEEPPNAAGLRGAKVSPQFQHVLDKPNTAARADSETAFETGIKLNRLRTKGN